MWPYVLKHAIPIAVTIGSLVTIGTLAKFTLGKDTPNWVYGMLVGTIIGLIVYLAPSIKGTIDGYNPAHTDQQRAAEASRAQERIRLEQEQEARRTTERLTKEKAAQDSKAPSKARRQEVERQVTEPAIARTIGEQPCYINRFGEEVCRRNTNPPTAPLRGKLMPGANGRECYIDRSGNEICRNVR
jgi:hypothetical protein